MSREIKFRGKRIDNGEWVCGYFCLSTNGETLIIPYVEYCNHRLWDGESPAKAFKVISETVGQFPGLHDKNGKKIYEGDLLRYPPKDEWEKTNFVAFEVFFHDNDCADRHIGFQMNRVHCQGSMGGYRLLESFLPRYTKQMEIIGNIYSNPELMEDKQ